MSDYIHARSHTLLDSLWNTGNTRDAPYYAQMIRDVINGNPGQCNLIITDSAPVMTAAVRILEREYPHVAHQPCVAHIVDLFMEDVGKLDGVKALVSECSGYVSFICNHAMPLAIFKEVSKLRLIRFCDTR